MFNSFTDTINALVATDVDDTYEGTGINDRTLGKMYYLSKYKKAADDEYNKLRKEVEVPTDLPEKQVIKNDSRYSAVAVPRRGSEKIDRALINAELRELLLNNAAYSGTEMSITRATIVADQIIDRCTTVGRDTVAVTIIEDRR